MLESEIIHLRPNTAKLKNRLYQVLIVLLLLGFFGVIALLFYGYYMSVILAEMTSEGLNSSITNFYNTQLESFCIDSEQENIEGL
ncbi:hypothetical protein LSTR_LSTR010883 [Laodelphax striatellus]|uniref:Uncharacterized protein n=1 Tax=Laodelphax striatellus TaxID=195883 RepID=A0A482XLV2_LAOST|nr:hypothetical protein LSTR_LSTR010883 [Laodelphax striatellus]